MNTRILFPRRRKRHIGNLFAGVGKLIAFVKIYHYWRMRGNSMRNAWYLAGRTL